MRKKGGGGGVGTFSHHWYARQEKKQGKKKSKMLDSLKSWLGTGKVTDMMLAARDRDVWKDMIANAMRPGT